MAASKSKKKTDFEQALQQLEALVNKLEQGDLSLEDSLQAFEAGIKLTRECQNTLSAAEQKVQVLLEQRGQLVSRPLDDGQDAE